MRSALPVSGCQRLEDGETAVIGQIGCEVDDLEDTRAEATRRWVVLEGEGGTEEVHWIFTAPQTTFGVTLQFTEDKGPREGRVSALGEGV